MKYFKEDHQYQSEKEKTVKLFFMKKSIHTPNNSHYKLRFKKKTREKENTDDNIKSFKIHSLGLQTS